MRCLQCGKAIPLLKRLGGSSEFCSEAHRREYQKEFSDLALGRLLQSRPAEFRMQAEGASILAGATAPAVDPHATAVNGAPALNGTPAANGTPLAAKPNAAATWAEMERLAITLPAPAAKPAGIAKPEPPPMTAAKNGTPPEAASQSVMLQPARSQEPVPQSSASQPATAPPAAIQKPAPAELQFALVAAPEFEHAFASLAPGRPHHRPDMSLAELPHGLALAWESAVRIANSITPPVESKLDLREMSRTAPKIALDLRIVPPDSLEIESQPLTITAAPALPAEAALWSGSHCDFAGELASLSGFADAQFVHSDFEVPALDEILPPEIQQAAVESVPPEAIEAIAVESPDVALSPTVQMPDPEFDPLPVSSMGIAPGKTKPVPVFGPTLIGTGTIQIPQPAGLPLRPLMVLSTATIPAVEPKHRNADVLRPRPAFSIASEVPQSTAPAGPSAELNLGLPELRMPVPSEGMPQMRKMIAAVAGVAVLGAGLFFFLGKSSDAGSKSPTPAASAAGSQWIANFAPDPKRQRRVSLLRSSMNLPAYRLDFESSIQMKALGWVYRARDAKNFYVSKIEFKKPGVNPVYALVHYAVIDGVEQPRVETPLQVSVPMGGLYKIHFEAVGNRFTTWVQGQQAEQWTDPRLSSGGAGLYGEGSEQSVLHGDFVVTPLQN